LAGRRATTKLGGKTGGLVVLLLAEQRRGWSLMIFCARATRGRTDRRRLRLRLRLSNDHMIRCLLLLDLGLDLLTGRGQWKINQPPSLKRQRASLEGSFISFDARIRGSTRPLLKMKYGIGRRRAVGSPPDHPD